MGKGVAMGAALAWACAVCFANATFAEPTRQDAEQQRLVPNEESGLAAARPPAPSDEDHPDVSVKRLARAGVTLAEMQRIPVSARRFLAGVPFDLQAPRDGRVLLTPNGELSAGTILWVQRDFSRFHELAGVRVNRPEAIPGVMISPDPSVPVELGAGLTVSLDERAENSLLASRAFFATFQLGLTF